MSAAAVVAVRHETSSAIAPGMRLAWRGAAFRCVQRGQALVLAVALLFVGLASLLMLGAAGRATITKHRLTDAADAAAYSAAVWRARVLNFEAYANRAIVANEVAVAQAVTLVSWSRYFERLAANAAQVARLYPPAGTVMQGVSSAASLARQSAQAAAQLEIAARAADTVGYKDLLQASQEAMHLTAMPFALTSLTQEVASASDPRFSAYLLAGDDFARFTRRYTSREDRQRLRGVVEASLDGFTGGARQLDLQLKPFVPSGCLLSLSPDRMFDWIRKRGATVLDDDMERWEAQDTVSLHHWRSRRGPFGIGGGCSENEQLPLGWGAGEAAETPLNTLQGDAHDTGRNAAARSAAATDIVSAGGYGGLARIRELDYERLADRRFPTSRFAVLAHTQGGRPVGNGPDPVDGAGRLRLRERFASGRLWALAAAEVAFRRPPSVGGIEYASLYSPYWQARLVEPTPAERSKADLDAR